MKTIAFNEFFLGLRNGALAGECSDQLDRLLEAIAETGDGGDMTVKLSFKLNKAGQLECKPSVSCKVPKRALGTGIFFLTDESRLTRTDPRQTDIEDDLAARREKILGEPPAH
tara:strand:+ start:26 stop:364 length:339 start_codon:yes stop_codon:yes gene_type:complete